MKEKKELGHEAVEPVEDREDDDDGGRGHQHTYGRDGRDDVDGVVRLLREEIAPCYVEREIQRELLIQQRVDMLDVV